MTDAATRFEPVPSAMAPVPTWFATAWSRTGIRSPYV